LQGPRLFAGGHEDAAASFEHGTRCSDAMDPGECVTEQLQYRHPRTRYTTLLERCKHAGEQHQVAIFDATNTTEERRQFLIDRFHNQVQYMFIESICNDEETLRKNVELKLKYSPDYETMDNDMVCFHTVLLSLFTWNSNRQTPHRPPSDPLQQEHTTPMKSVQAVKDFNARIKEYEKVYVPLTDGKSNRHIHFIQLVNMVTGKGHMDVNRISGYIPGKIVFFLMQVIICPRTQ
jgi:6-phosphofructo-2-kinase / fructose-2,6-biphosphatase 3